MSEVVEQINQNPAVNVAFSDEKDSTWVSVAGSASVVHDREPVAGQRRVREDVEQRVRVLTQNSATPSSGVEACA